MSELHRYEERLPHRLRSSQDEKSATSILPNLQFATPISPYAKLPHLAIHFVAIYHGAPDGRGFFPPAGSLDIPLSKFAR